MTRVGIVRDVRDVREHDSNQYTTIYTQVHVRQTHYYNSEQSYAMCCKEKGYSRDFVEYL